MEGRGENSSGRPLIVNNKVIRNKFKEHFNISHKEGKMDSKNTFEKGNKRRQKIIRLSVSTATAFNAVVIFKNSSH